MAGVFRYVRFFLHPDLHRDLLSPVSMVMRNQAQEKEGIGKASSSRFRFIMLKAIRQNSCP
jgi:hypothetical protein